MKGSQKMKPGQKLNDASGNQILLFPLDVMNITQWHGQGTYSHLCGQEFDTTGRTASYPLYAPCDCHVIHKYDVWDSGFTRLYTNDKPVRTPNGVHQAGTVVFGFTHRNGVLNQESFKQGEHIYNTGTSGHVTGDHVHIDQSYTPGAQLIPCTEGQSWIINGSTNPTAFWYLNDTEITNGWGQNWAVYKGGDKPPEPPKPEKKKGILLLDSKGIDIMFI
jgi:hypothetical protein